MKYRNRFFSYLLVVLSYATYMWPLTEKSSLLENNTGKRVLLLGDIHCSFTERFLDKACEAEQTKQLACATRSLFDAVKSKQQHDLTCCAKTMLADDNKQGAQTVVVCEMNKDLLATTCNEYSSVDAMYVLPYVLANHLMKPASTPQDKLAILKQSMSPFCSLNNSFQISNKLRVVAADCFRSNPQDILLKTIDATNPEDLPALKQELPEDLSKINIGDLKQDLLDWRPMFKQLSMKGTSTKQLLGALDKELHAGSIAESDLLIDQAMKLNKNAPEKARFLSDHLFRFRRNKCNLELLLYVKEFEDDPALKYMIMSAGMGHTDFVQERLENSGYHVVAQVHESRLNDINVEEAASEQSLTELSTALTTLQQKSPHELLPKIFQA